MEALKRVSRLLTLIKDLLTLLYVHFGPRILTQAFRSICCCDSPDQDNIAAEEGEKKQKKGTKGKEGKRHLPLPSIVLKLIWLWVTITQEFTLICALIWKCKRPEERDMKWPIVRTYIFLPQWMSLNTCLQHNGVINRVHIYTHRESNSAQNYSCKSPITPPSSPELFGTDLHLCN